MFVLREMAFNMLGKLGTFFDSQWSLENVLGFLGLPKASNSTKLKVSTHETM